METPDRHDLIEWATLVLDTALHQDQAYQERLGIGGNALAAWLHHEWQDRDHESVTSLATALQRDLNAYIWHPDLDMDREDMFQGKDMFNMGYYIWAVPILNANTPVRVFEDVVLDAVAKAVFTFFATGFFDEHDTTLISQHLTDDMEARSRSHRSFDDRKGFDSFRLLLYFFLYYDETTRDIKSVPPLHWLLASWRDLRYVHKEAF